jgi:Glu-tRNA(Gln) amidotransferase subunit E-like FAD-binding protein
MKEKQVKAGLEIHQQLDSGKLFCSCPSFLRKDNPDFEIKRRLHRVAGEKGEVDDAVEYEAGKDREFIYQGYNENTCLVEMDEEPPHSINQDALKIGVQISLLLNCRIVQNSQIMRKTVIDGSNTSGFQRTVLIARDGFVDIGGKRVGIWYVYLEEDAARTVEERDGTKVYRLDRLGIPLVEIVTAPDIENPEQAKQTALKIGEILRACRVRRGIGTIRQDINVSIKGHPRAEIKGFQDPRIFVDVVEKEVKRQEKDIKSGKKLSEEVRGANEDGTTRFLRPLPGGARMYPETDLPVLHISKKLIDDARKEIPKMKAEIREELKKKGLNEELIKVILKEDRISDFEELLKVDDNPDLVGKMISIWKADISRKQGISREKVEKKLSIDVLETILQEKSKGNISKEDIPEIMEDIAKGKKIEEALKREKADNLEEEIMKIVNEKPGLSVNAYMGVVMGKFRGKASGKQVMEILKKLIK